jgi:phosphoenolpyruvate carboxykinase (GTP)
LDRCEGQVGAQDTPIGYLPLAADVDTAGLQINNSDLASLLQVDKAQWIEELDAVGEYFDEYGDRLPEALRREQEKVVNNLS